MDSSMGISGVLNLRPDGRQNTTAAEGGPDAMPRLEQGGSASSGPPGPLRRLYLRVLLWAFTLFSSIRVLSYLPTMFALHASGDTSQHSLWTWGTWLGANLTMAAWLHETDGHRFRGPALLSLANAAMCLLITAQIIALRIGNS